MYDIIVLALQTDITRVVTFKLATREPVPRFRRSGSAGIVTRSLIIMGTRKSSSNSHGATSSMSGSSPIFSTGLQKSGTVMGRC
ncbi:MAG: hypothetical protein Ct9H300mP7_0610 [Verrucomicrobiota bacterium]|nr:MAG: hypothetical protein Ct9H300mP7_0610 [Verrucomicrobiota bacterium]